MLTIVAIRWRGWARAISKRNGKGTMKAEMRLPAKTTAKLLCRLPQVRIRPGKATGQSLQTIRSRGRCREIEAIARSIRWESRANLHGSPGSLRLSHLDQSR